MSKKDLLNEQTIRRFGGLAGIQPGVTSHFLTEVEVGEEELADALAAGAEAMADTLGLPVSVEVEAGEGEELEDELEDDVDGLEDEFGDLEGEEDEIEDEEFAIDDEEDALEDEEETLDELINRILQEDDDELTEDARTRAEEEGYKDGERDEKDDLEEGEGSKKGEYKRRDKNGKVGKRAGDVDGHYKAYEKNEGRRGQGSGHTHGRGTGREDARFEGLQVVDDEYLMQEVSKRVKYRLAQLVKEQRQRKRRTKKRRR